MRSLAKIHKAKALKTVAEKRNQQRAKAQILSPKTQGLAGLDYDIVEAQFERHCDQLSALNSIDEKVEFKKSILPDYIQFLTEYQQKGERYPNAVLSRVVFWLLDTGDIHNAFNFAKLAIEQQQIQPAGFKRTLTTAFVESIADWAERQYKADASAEPYLTECCDLCLSKTFLVDQIIVLNKLFKIAGLYAEKAGDNKKAILFYEHCVRVNPQKHGVKTRLDKLRAKNA